MKESTKNGRQAIFRRHEVTLADMKQNSTLRTVVAGNSELEKALDNIKNTYLANNLYFTKCSNADDHMYCMNGKIFVIHIPNTFLMYLDHDNEGNYLVTMYSPHNISYKPRAYREYIIDSEDLMEDLHVSIPQEKIYKTNKSSTHFSFSTLIIKDDIPKFIEETLNFLISCEKDTTFKQREAELYKLTQSNLMSLVNPDKSEFEHQLKEIDAKYLNNSTFEKAVMYKLNNCMFIIHVCDSIIIYIEHVERSFYIVTVFSTTNLKYKHDMRGFSQSEHEFLDDISDAGLSIPMAKSYFDVSPSTHYSFSTYIHEKHIIDVVERLLDQL